MRRLVGCPRCKRQLDASAMAVGSRFRCRCGEVVAVPDVVPHDADVVRCSSCGGTRAEGALSCRYCGSDFTIHEQDLETICPTCFARISDRARFCHHCATPIVPADTAGVETPSLCPACGSGHPLYSRALGEASLSTLECRRCAGLWLENEAFRILSDRARELADPAAEPSAIRSAARAPSPSKTSGPAYRPCPSCTKRMNRSNFGKQSGILVDRCREHGIWFDASELEAALQWIRSGGEARTEARRRDEERVAASAARFHVEPKAPEDAWREGRDSAWEEGGILSTLLRLFSTAVR